MRRNFLNVLCAAVIALGGAHLVSPPEAAAAAEACCISPEAGGCCGDQCEIKNGVCSACTGFWKCLFF